MREIKFRQMVFGEWLYWTPESAYNDVFWTSVHHESLSQYTGLHDKNGKEIYEGDIVHPLNYTGDWIGVVQWRSPGFWIFEVAGDYSGEETTWSATIRCEVIGNIYENPELINE